MNNKNYRHIFKWGEPSHEEKLDNEMLKFIKRTFNLNNLDIKKKYLPGLEEVKLKKKNKLSPQMLKGLMDIVGENNVSADEFDRASHAYGKAYLDLIKLRLGNIDSPPDAVVYPRNEDNIVQIISFCSKHRIPVTPFGGHSSVTRGVETPNGGVSLDMTRYMNNILEINPINHTVTVEPGITGPALEKYLNNYGDGYTCGHFPQSFEFSTVGGWVCTRGAGQASTGYGKIEDIVLSMKMVTPKGVITTKDYPAAALGPDIDQILIGSEGTFGILTKVTLKIRKYLPAETGLSSFIFKDFDSAITTMREVMQGQFGRPYVFRVSDPEETDIAFEMKGKNGTLTDKILQLLGYKQMKRCLMFITVDGDADYTKLVISKIKKIARRNGGLCIGSSPVKHWLEQRYSSSYLRDPLMDLGIMTDTLETAVTWDNLIPLWKAVCRHIKKRANTLCMSHISHCYENGANLYFTFLSPMNRDNNIDDYLQFQKGIIDAIKLNEGSLSHHHGIGKMFAPWMNEEIGETGLGLLQKIKDYFDDKKIMNPGGTLGLKK